MSTKKSKKKNGWVMSEKTKELYEKRKKSVSKEKDNETRKKEMEQEDNKMLSWWLQEMGNYLDRRNWVKFQNGERESNLRGS